MTWDSLPVVGRLPGIANGLIATGHNMLGLTLAPPDINRSTYHFSVETEKKSLYGLAAIKGVGRAAVEALIDVGLTPVAAMAA